MVRMTHQLVFAFSFFLLLAFWTEGTASSDELLTTLESTTFNDFIHLTPDIIYNTTPDPPNLDTKPTPLPKFTGNGRPSQKNSVTKISPKQHAKNEAQDPIIRNGRSVDTKDTTLKPRSTACKKKSPTTLHARSSTFSETTETSEIPVTSRTSNTIYPKTSSTKGASFRITSVSPKTTTINHEGTGASVRSTSVLSKSKATSYEGIGTLDRTTIVSPKTTTIYHEGMGISERTIPHLNKTTGNTSKDTRTSGRTTSLSKITRTSHESTGASDRTISVSSEITDTSHKGLGVSDRTTTVSHKTITTNHEGMGVSDMTTSHLDKTTGHTPKDTETSEMTTSLSQITSTSHNSTGDSDRTTSVSPKTITIYHEGMGVSDRTTLHLDKTISNTPKDTGTSEMTTSLSQITSTSHEITGASDRTTAASPKITDTSHKNMESSFRTISVPSQTATTYHEGMGASDRTTAVSLKVTVTSHKETGTSIIGDLNKVTGASNGTSAFDKTTGWTVAVSDKVTESLGTSYKSTSASDKTIGTVEPTIAMGSSDKTITFGGTSEKMTKSSERTTGIDKTATSSHQTLEASDKIIQISDKTTKASGATRPSETTGPLGNTTHKSTSTPCNTSTVHYPPLQVTTEKTFAPLTTLNKNQELNSTKSVIDNWPDQKTDNSKGGSQNGATQGMLEGNSFPAWAIVIVVLVAVILLLLFIGLFIMAVYTIRMRHHRVTTDQEENDAEDEVAPNSYPVFLMEQQTLGRNPLPLP